MKLRNFLTPLCAIGLMAGCDQKPADTQTAPGAPAQQDAAAAQTTATETDATPGTAATDAAPPVVTVETDTVEEVVLPDPVALVNGKPVSREEFEKALNEIFGSMGLQPSMLPAEQRTMLYRQFAEDLIIDKLIDEASKDVEITDADVDAEIAKIAGQYGSQDRFNEELTASGQNIDEFKTRLAKILRQRKWMESQAPASSEVTDADVKTFYEENIEEFKQPDLVRASHILIRVEEDADEATVAEKQKTAADLAARAKKGEDFAKLAAEFSEDPTAKENSGDLSFFPKDRMVPEFAEAAFASEIDTITEPVRTQFGWHVIKVTEKKEAETLPIEQVKENIAEYLKDGKQQQAVDQVMQKLRQAADVQINLPEAPAGGMMLPGMGAPQGE